MHASTRKSFDLFLSVMLLRLTGQIQQRILAKFLFSASKRFFNFDEAWLPLLGRGVLWMKYDLLRICKNDLMLDERVLLWWGVKGGYLGK